MPVEILSSRKIASPVDEDGQRPLRVVIADDHPIMLFALRRVFERETDIEVVGEASASTQLFAIIERRRPDIVLLDLHMPGLDGPSCIAHISTTWPELKVVVLSGSDDRASIDSALTSGACAYVVKSLCWTDLAGVLRQAKSGAIYHAPSVPARAADAEQPAGPGLTARETMILRAVADGLTTSAISKQLWVSEHTVKFHLTNIYRKLGVSNRSAAVRCALEQHLTLAS
jgi:DNA-binding NarL/FixJ family response regulator